MKTISRLMMLWLIAVVCCACHKDTPRRVTGMDEPYRHRPVKSDVHILVVNEQQQDITAEVYQKHLLGFVDGKTNGLLKDSLDVTDNSIVIIAPRPDFYPLEGKIDRSFVRVLSANGGAELECEFLPPVINNSTWLVNGTEEILFLVGIYNAGKPIYEISVPNRPGGIWVKLQLSDGVVTPLKWKGE